MRTKTWRCPGCDACTIGDDRPGLCSVCGKHEMALWNISEDSVPVPLIHVGLPDVPVSRWLEDRSENRCLLCDKPLAKLLPQGFVALVVKNDGHTFPIGAACERCAWKNGKPLAIEPVLYAVPRAV